MKSIEPQKAKIVYCVYFTIFFIITSNGFIWHADRSVNANSLSLAYPSENVLGYIPSYDLCTTPYFKHEVSDAEFQVLV